MLAAFTTKRYNTGAQIHKKHEKEKRKKTQLVYKLTRVHPRGSMQFAAGAYTELGRDGSG